MGALLPEQRARAGWTPSLAVAAQGAHFVQTAGIV